MWKLYSESENSIAVQTTFAKLATALPKEVCLGQVRYLDYEKDVLPDANAFTPFTCKRKSFEHEREVRAIVWSLAGSVDGRVNISRSGAWVEVDLNNLIERVYVSPAAQPWFSDVIGNAMAKYGLKARLQHSDLKKEPIY